MAFDLHSTRSQSDEHFTTRCGRPEHTSRLDESLSWKATAYIGSWFFLLTPAPCKADHRRLGLRAAV